MYSPMKQKYICEYEMMYYNFFSRPSCIILETIVTQWGENELYKKWHKRVKMFHSTRYETLWPLHRRDMKVMAFDITQDTDFISTLLSLARKTSLLAVWEGNTPAIPPSQRVSCVESFSQSCDLPFSTRSLGFSTVHLIGTTFSDWVLLFSHTYEFVQLERFENVFVSVPWCEYLLLPEC